MLNWLMEPANWLIVLQVAFGLGMVIFVHELGHFAVAKWCGVKCEKFYLGFDIYGLKLCKFRWGETEYGIGILPLGGYVKMLGQDDNPANAAKEAERARVQHVPGGAPAAEPTAEDRAAGFDPRSYMAQSVPKRMAIISAGVIMNVIFAFVVSVAAYAYGVNEPPCVVGAVQPGEAAWIAGLQVGDRIVQIGDLRNPRFRDLQSSVVLGDDLDEGVPFIVDRPGVDEHLSLRIVPDRKRGAPTIGAASAGTTTLRNPPLLPVWDKRLGEALRPGDKIIQVDGQPVETHGELIRLLARQRGPATLTMERLVGAADGGQQTDVVQVAVPARPIREVGVSFEIGPVTALRKGGPAETAGVRVGDRLLRVDGQGVGDPLSLPDRLAARAGEPVTLTLNRQGEELDVTIEQLADFVYEQPFLDAQVSLPTLGLAYSVSPVVAAAADDLADRVRPGDELVGVKLSPPADAVQARRAREIEETVSGDQPVWPVLFMALQHSPAGTRVELSLRKGGTVTIEPIESTTWFNPDRGLQFQPLLSTHQAQGVAEALSLGRRETWDSLTQVYRFLRKLATGQVSPQLLGGPVMIAAVAGDKASEGLSAFLLFLGMLSANLAVINFLPIPVLDGGHFVFLTLEGIRGKPVSERMVIAFHYAGFFFIISLMLFVLSLDMQRFVLRS